MRISRSMHVAAKGIISCCFMDESYSLVYMHHIFFIQSSVDEHLGCFHVSAVVNSATVNIGVHVHFKIFFLGICPGVRSLAQMAVLFSVFEGNSIMFSIVVAIANIPTNGVGVFSFLHIISTIYCL